MIEWSPLDTRCAMVGRSKVPQNVEGSVKTDGENDGKQCNRDRPHKALRSSKGF